MREIISHKKCLLLNSDYTPLHIIGWKKALMWSIRYSDNNKFGIEIIDFYKNDYICGINDKKYTIPAVAKTQKYFGLHNQRVNFSRRNILIRDDYTCQYCGLQKNINDLTHDHVIPKSVWSNKLFSPTNWTNIVTACVGCNRKKGNRTPKQSNMPLKNLPIAPYKTSKYLPLSGILNIIKQDIPSEWLLYLPKSYS
jgi:hypothetical protein